MADKKFKEMKVLVTGAAGMLGSALCPVLQKEGHKVVSTDINVQDGEEVQFLDVRDAASVSKLVKNEKPDMIMHLAAETDVDKCEIEVDHAYMTNLIGTQNAALVCQKYNAIMVYISTGAVFDGDKCEPYTEFDVPNPINVYGRTKWEGERIVQNFLHRYYIMRAGWMIGGGRKDKKFVAKIIDLLGRTNRLKVVADNFGSPTYTVDFSKCIRDLIKTDYYGLYHMANKGVCSRYDISKEIVKILGRKDVAIEPVPSAYFPSPAPRSRSEMLRNYRLDLLGMNTMRPWEEALREYVQLNFGDKGIGVPS